jgi:hypothetical protein
LDRRGSTSNVRALSFWIMPASADASTAPLAERVARNILTATAVKAAATL